MIQALLYRTLYTHQSCTKLILGKFANRADASIAQVVAELNRYFPRAIRLEGAGLNDLRFSGVLKLDDETTVLGRLQEFLPVEAQDQSDSVILRRKVSRR